MASSDDKGEVKNLSAEIIPKSTESNIPYTAPQFMATAFNCPHCNAFAHQIWYETHYSSDTMRGSVSLKSLNYVRCSQCFKYSLWHYGKIIYPQHTGIELPNPDLNPDIKDDYMEAASILNLSPRGAAALLRLCVQKLCVQLGGGGNNLNDDIGNLVKKGLDEEIQQALDALRVIGNNAVHPGEINLKDDTEIATALFGLVNLTADEMISRKKRVKGVYKKLPPGAVEQISKRDQSK